MIGKSLYACVFMLALILRTAAFAGETTAQERSAIQDIIIAEALRTELPPSLALAVAKVESNFRAQAESKAGARGVMQIMPNTARKRYGVDPDELFSPELNVQLGIDFLVHLYHHYDKKWDLALSHYNGGVIKNWRQTGKPHAYTESYIENVKRWQRHFETILVAENDIWPTHASILERSRSPGIGAVKPKHKPALQRTDQAYTVTQTNPMHTSGQVRSTFRGDFFTRLQHVRRTLDDFAEGVFD